MYTVDQDNAQKLGHTLQDVASDMLTPLRGSGQTAPNFWLTPANGVTYNIGVQTPQYRIHGLENLAHTPVAPAAAPGAPMTMSPTTTTTTPSPTLQIFTNHASERRQITPAVVNHYNVAPVYDVFLSVDQRDLGGVGSDVDKIINEFRPHLPRGSTISVRGQLTSMRSSFVGLVGGVLFAMVLVYLMLVINFQTWLDPLVIIMALPGAIAGILWMLFVTQTTFNVPSLMGTIMAMGVATSNSVLLITFAEDHRKDASSTSTEAAIAAGTTRFRPVIMTALAKGILPRRARTKAVATVVAQNNRAPAVSVITIDTAPGASTVILPGSVTAYATTPIYARVPGYIGALRVDIGSRVRRGELLARIDAPELDHQVQQARAVVTPDSASLVLAAVELRRWRLMLTADSAVTLEEVDIHQATYNVALATLSAAIAALRQLLSMQSYERVIAPFDGIITARNIDLGALV